MERLWLVSYGLAWLLTVAQVLTLVALLWALGRVHLRRAPEAHALITDEGPEIHTRLPDFEGREAAGRLIRSTDYRGRELALLLLSADCSPCEQLTRAVLPARRGMAAPPEFLVVIEGPHVEAEAYVRRYRVGCPVIADEEGAIRSRLQVERTPYGFLIDRQGMIRMKGVVNDRWQLEGLLGRRGQRLGGLFWVGDSSEPDAQAGTTG